MTWTYINTFYLLIKGIQSIYLSICLSVYLSVCLSVYYELN